MDNLDHLIANLLNISSNDIESILSNIDNGTTNIFLTLKKSVHHCPFCNSSKLRSKGFFSKKLFIPNLPFENVIVHQRIRRLYCLDCLHSFSDRHYMAPINHSVSYATLMTLMKLLLNPKMTFKSAAELTHLSESIVIRLFDKYCHIKRYSFPKAICIDEVYTKNSDFKSKYSCIFYDFYNHTIIDVIPCRRKDYLHSYFQKISRSELDNVSYVCIDMYETYRTITQLYFKKAIICVDSFHVIKHLNDDLSKLRVRIIFPKVVVQRCIVHLIRNSIKYVPTKDYKKFTQSLKKVYGAPNLKTANASFDIFCKEWKQYPGAIEVWKRNYAHVEQLFDYGSAV